MVECSPGDVLVVEVIGDDPCARALVGDVMAYAAKKKKIAGLVTNGAVRDWDKLRELDFPVYCCGVNIIGPAKVHPGEHGMSVSLGGAVICAGDLILGDSDGCVAVAAQNADAVVATAHERSAAEAKVLRAIDGGATTLDVYGAPPQ